MSTLDIVNKAIDDGISALQVERSKVLDSPEFKALCVRRDELIAQIQPLENELREVQAKLKAAEAPSRPIGNQIAALVRAKESTKTLQNGDR